MRFYGPLFILLTAFSPNLEANSIEPDITTYPYLLDLRLFNVDSGLASLQWSGTEVDFKTFEPSTGGFTGEIRWDLNGGDWVTRGFSGYMSGNSIVFSTVFPFIGTVWQGNLDPSLRTGYGRLDGLGTSNMTGVWSLRAVDLPAAGVLLICALGTIPLFARRKTKQR